MALQGVLERVFFIHAVEDEVAGDLALHQIDCFIKRINQTLSRVPFRGISADGDEGCFFAGEQMLPAIEGVEPVDDVLDRAGPGIPIKGRDEDEVIRFVEGLGDRVEVVIEDAGLALLVALVAVVAFADFEEGGVEAFDLAPFLRQIGNQKIRELGGIPFLAIARRYDNN